MKLTAFRYLRGRRLLTLALILISASTLFSMTAFSLLSLEKGFSTYQGEGEDIVAIFDRRSRTPFTGVVPAYLTERIGSIHGVLASSPEALAPCFVENEPVFLRGIVPEDFTKLDPFTIVDGEMLCLSDIGSMMIGKSLAERLKLKPGDKALVLAVLRDRYLELRVKGVFQSHSATDDEILAPLYVGQWLRGTDYAHVSLLRFKIDRSMVSSSRIFEAVAKEATESGSSDVRGWRPPDSIIRLVRAQFKIGDLGVEEAHRLMETYLNRYGVTREAILILSVMVFIFSSASVAAASSTIINQHREEIDILRSIGASEKTVKRDIMVKLLPWSLASSAVGIVLAAAILVMIQGYGYVQLLSHSVPLDLSPIVVVLNSALVVSLVATIIWWSHLQ